MFIICSRLNGFWNSVFQNINLRTNFHFTMTEANILFGFDTEGLGKEMERKANIANHIILIAKMSISKMKFGHLKQIFVIFETELTARKKYIA